MYADRLWRTCKDIQTRLMQTVQIVQTFIYEAASKYIFYPHRAHKRPRRADKTSGRTSRWHHSSALSLVYCLRLLGSCCVLCYFVSGDFPHVLSILRWPRGHVFGVKQIRVWTFQFSVFSDLYLSPRFSSCSFADLFLLSSLLVYEIEVAETVHSILA